MLLRSSSAPFLGSLLPSESPNNNNNPPRCCSAPPFSDCGCLPSGFGFRRTRSDGNLQSLFSDDHNHSIPCIRSSGRRPDPILETSMSLSIYGPNAAVKGSDPENEVEKEQEEEEEEQSDFFGFWGRRKDQATSMPTNPPLFLARGLGIDRVGSGLLIAGGEGIGGGYGGSCSTLTGDGGGGEERSETEMFYRKMVQENPNNPLLLRNYAQFLSEEKGDLQRAEEYYSRAVLVAPDDGEILSQYAKLVWELHRDEERAASYFQQAVQAAPHDSHVLAAYADFLWESEEENDGIGAISGKFDGGAARDFGDAPMIGYGSPMFSPA